MNVGCVVWYSFMCLVSNDDGDDDMDERSQFQVFTFIKPESRIRIFLLLYQKNTSDLVARMTMRMGVVDCPIRCE